MQDILQNRIETVTLQNRNVTVIVALPSKKPYQLTLYISYRQVRNSVISPWRDNTIPYLSIRNVKCQLVWLFTRQSHDNRYITVL